MAVTSSDDDGSLPPLYQVFINFRGDELRKSFVGFLVKAMRCGKINVFTDKFELNGTDLQNLFRRIEESRVAVAIFSERYTESHWCLDELVKMKELMDQGKLVVIPVFYRLNATACKTLAGTFGDKFRKLEWEYRSDPERIQKWKQALISVSNNIGLESDIRSDESMFVDSIVENVKRVLSEILTEYIPAVRTENPRDKFIEVPSGKFGTKPEGSSTYAKMNVDFLDRTFTNSPMDGKVKPPNIQVFINFRGDQLRNNFVGYLEAALRGSGINIFIDTKANIGDDLINLFKRIEDSGIAIVVFSSRYTESEWCLNELVKIKERAHQGLLKVLPIFYKVTPGNVKRLKGEFGDNFRDKEYMYASDERKIKQWKEAIVFVSHKFALTFDEKSSVLEIDFIETIVKEVLKMLQAFSTVESGQSSP